MTITTLPTKTVGSLGPVKTDTRAYLNTTTELAAAELEQIKSTIIALATEVGLTDGSTAGSLREAVIAAAATDLVWEWNETDLTEFGTPMQFEDDLSNESGSAAASVTEDVTGRSVILLTATSLRGGWLLPVAAEFFAPPETYPRRYTIEAEIGLCSNASINVLIGLAMSDAGGIDTEGISYEIVPNSTTTGIRKVEGNAIDGTLGTDGAGSAGTFDADAQRVGMQIRVEVEMYDDGAPAYRVRSYIATQDGFTCAGNAKGNSGYKDISGLTQNLDSVGIGFWCGSAQSGTVQIRDLRVKVHPLA